MCGIVGVQCKTTDKIIRRMARAIEHRGPDDDGYYSDNNISLAHKRLSIIDLKSGKQPIWNENKTKLIIYNGEVYNYRELRKELVKEGYKFRTKSDTEVILAAVDRWGHDAVKRFNGMFAFAIWDKKNKELFLARDRLGIKPLYYHKKDGLLIFASEIKAIIEHPDVKSELNPEALSDFVTFQNILDDKTFFKGIKKLLPGHYMINGEVTQYWDINYRKKRWTPKKALDEYRKRIKESVKRHMISDVPLGAYLSGGFDSSTVAMTASELTDSKLSTFTGTFPEGGQYTEIPCAHAVADKIGAKGHEITIRPEDFIPSMPSIVYHLDEPTTGCGAFPQYHVSKLVSRHVKVVLTGHGGDELFAGYQAYKGVYYREIMKKNPFNVFRILTGLKPSELARIGYYLIFPLFQPEVRHGIFIMFPPSEQKKLFTPQFYSKLKRYKPMKTVAKLLEGKNLSGSDAAQYLYLKTYLPALFAIEDSVGMAHSIEARTPICDNEIVEFAASIPMDVKLTKNMLKYIPKMAMKGKLPEMLYHQPKKGFPTPLIPWFRGPLKKHMYDVLCGKRARERGIFNSDYIKKQLDALTGRNTDTLWDYAKAHRLYSLYTVELWFRIFIDGEDPENMFS